MNKLLGISLCLGLLACAPESDEPAEFADLIFVGNNIITMDESNIEAVAVVGDRIAATGTADNILVSRGPDTRVVELGDRALLPGFIDAHGHLAVVARLIDYVNVSSPPVGTVDSIGDIQKLLRGAIAKYDIPAGSWIVGYGYDESLLDEQRHPTRDDLDAVSTDHPIMLLHVSQFSRSNQG